VGDSDWLCGDRPTQADITVAVAWRFTHYSAPAWSPTATTRASPPWRPMPRPCRPLLPPTIHKLKAPMIGRITGRLAEKNPRRSWST
jgi:glutathione S-transferase